MQASFTRSLAAATVLAVLLAGVGAALAQFGRDGVRLDERTDAGSWEGTWYYVNRDSRVAMWIRDEGGKPEVRIQYLETSRVESFITDWNGQATYRFRGKPGTFSFELTERDENTIRGKWKWELGQGELRRTETAWVTMYRAGDGRLLVMDFEDLERFHGGMVGSYMNYQQVWTFLKASNHEHRWEELPF